MKKYIAGLRGIPRCIAGFYNDEKGGRWLYRNRCYVTVFFVLLVINVIFMLPMKAPMIIDEYMTFSDSAFLSGKYDWSSTYSVIPGTPYYGYTQGLFYIPFFYLPISIYSVFKIALFINACLIALIPVCVLYITNQISEESGFSNIAKMMCAIAIGSYSAYIYNSKGVWNETMLMVCPWLLASILFKLYNGQSRKGIRVLWSAICGIACIYYYALNARAVVGVIAVVCVLLVVRVVLKIKMVNFLAFGVSGGIAYFIHKCIKHYLVSSLLLVDGQAHIQNSSYSVGTILKRIHPETLLMAVKGYFGNVYYVFLVSFGLVGIAIAWFVYLLYNLLKKNKGRTLNNKQFIFSMFSILGLFGTWAMFFLVSYDKFSLKDFTKQDVMMYGRYFDAAIPLVILSVISLFESKEKDKKRIIFAGCLLSGIILLMGTLVTGGILVELNYLSAQPLNVGMPIAFAGKTFGGKTTWGDMWILFGTVTIILAIVAASLKKKKYVLGFGCLFVFYMYAAVCTLSEYCWPTSSSQFEKYQNVSEFFNTLEKKGIQYNKVYFLSNGYRDRGINIQYAVPNHHIEQINYYLEGYNCLEDIEYNSIVFGNHNVHLDTFFDEMYLVENDDLFVWSYGEELARQFESSGYVVSEKNSIIIEHDECASREVKGYLKSISTRAAKGNYDCQLIIKGKELTDIQYESIQYEGMDSIKLIKYDEEEIVVSGYKTNDSDTVRFFFEASPSFSLGHIANITVVNMETGRNFFTHRNELVVDSAVMLENGGLLYGQYITLTSGDYLVSIVGDYLDEALFDYCWGRGIYVTDVQEFVRKDANEVVFIMSVDEVRDDLEIRVMNPNSQTVLVDSIIIQPILQDGKLTDHNKVGFCPIRMSIDDSFARGEFINSIYESGRDFVHFGKGNGILVNNVDLEEGEYFLEILGEDVMVDITFLSEDGEYIPTIEQYVTQVGDSGITYTLVNYEEVKNVQIVINTLSSSDYLTAPNNGIVKISDINIIKK